MSVQTTGDQVAAVIQGQLDAMRARGYHHTDVLHTDLTVLNAASGLYRGTFSWRDHNRAEIACPTVTCLVNDGQAGLRITVLATAAG